MKKTWKLGLGLTLIMLLAGCGGGGSGSSDNGSEEPSGGEGPVGGGEPTPTEPGEDETIVSRSGLYLGTINNGSRTTDATILLSTTGDMAEFVERAELNTYASGVMVFDESGFSAPLVEFFQGQRRAEGKLVGDYTANSFSGEALNAAGESNASFQFDRVPEISDLEPSFSILNGTWSSNPDATTAITVGPDGSLQGSNTIGCVFSGAVTIPENMINLYRTEMEVSNCNTDPGTGFTAEQQNGAYSGYGFYVPASADVEAQFVMMDDNQELNRYFVFTQ